MNNKIEKFQFTPLREGRRCLGHASFALTAISIHAPPRGATFCMWYTPSIVVISIHAPPRGATSAPRQGKRHAPYFNSRPSARGDKTGARPERTGKYFNSRPSARGDFLRVGHNLPVIISIHAPPRGATRKSFFRIGTAAISIHAPPRGATRPLSSRGFIRIYFNSRPSARGDIYKPPSHQFVVISIHAPPRGATIVFTKCGMRSVYFNSRPSARGDTA